MCEKAIKVVTFVDLAGHPKFAHTTAAGLSARQPDFVLLVVSATAGHVQSTDEHLAHARALGIPLIVVVNKTDACTSEALVRTLQQVLALIKSPTVGKVPLLVTSEDDVMVAANPFSSNVVPVFMLSAVSGQNLGLFRTFLNLLPTNAQKHGPLATGAVDFQVKC